MNSGARSDEVLVVGGGISGIACARTLHDAGVPTVVRDRGYRLGGRMAVRTVNSRPVDIGASYFTARHPDFLAVVNAWEMDGLVRKWTDTFHLATPEGILGTTTGPVRYSAPIGLRSLVEALSVGLAVSSHDDVTSVSPGPRVDNREYAAVVLAMPGPQALDVLSEELKEERTVSEQLWEPTVALVASYAERDWPELDGVFVNDSPVLTFVADDGSRRGDGRPVLVAHSHPVLAASQLDDPERLMPAMLDELHAVMGIRQRSADAFVKRWSLAKPIQPRSQSFHLGRARVGLCGDGWHRASKIESAFLSGRALGRAIARTVGVTV